MSESPKFEVIDRRKAKAEQEQRAGDSSAAETTETTPIAEETKAPSAGPHLVVNETPSAAEPEEAEETLRVPEPPSAEESHAQKSAYGAASERLDDLVRAQNPGMDRQPPIVYESLLQQLYLSAMIAMGAGTPEGQRPRIDILGARQTIDLIAVLAEKTKGNLTTDEDKATQTVLYEARMAFLELTKMISMQAAVPPQPPPSAKK
jgi:hypothetical protein